MLFTPSVFFLKLLSNVGILQKIQQESQNSKKFPISEFLRVWSALTPELIVGSFKSLGQEPRPQLRGRGGAKCEYNRNLENKRMVSRFISAKMKLYSTMQTPISNLSITLQLIYRQLSSSVKTCLPSFILVTKLLVFQLILHPIFHSLQ